MMAFELHVALLRGYIGIFREIVWNLFLAGVWLSYK